jgi:hypothetical protein
MHYLLQGGKNTTIIMDIITGAIMNGLVHKVLLA